MTMDKLFDLTEPQFHLCLLLKGQFRECNAIIDMKCCAVPDTTAQINAFGDGKSGPPFRVTTVVRRSCNI